MTPDDSQTTRLSILDEGDAPPLTVWLGSAMYTFPAGRDATVGRGRDCDICLHDGEPADLALISRLHAILRFDDNQWVAIDKSQNGVFADGNRQTLVAIHDGRSITLGGPRGPQLAFRVAESAGPAEPRNPTTVPNPPTDEDTSTTRFSPPVSTTSPTRPPSWRRTRQAETTAPVPRQSGPAARTTSVGRAKTNGIVIDDPLASRVHAVLESGPTGLVIRDNDSSNGTFLNGTPVARALLRDGDVVTIANTDLVASGHTLVPKTGPGTTAGGLTAQGLNLTVDGHRLLQDVSFSAQPGTLTAVIGPSGAGKSTLLKLIAGATAPSAGIVTFDEHDVHAEYASMRSRIGMVPQDDVVHRQLTVEQALRYAAELRLPPDTTAADRRAVVDGVLAELDLTAHRSTRVDKLSGGQRKRASVAMELLTGPSLLILDEPTSGLDPALDLQVMTMLRRLADAGRVVVVVTHSLTYVDECDQIVLLAPGGKTAFADPPAEIGPVMGSTDWADIFATVSTDPDGVHRAYLARHPAVPPHPPSGVAPLGTPPHTSLWRQAYTLARRQIRLITADRGYFVFLVALPFVLGVLALAVPGSTGLGYAPPRGPEPDEPNSILVLLNLAAVFTGTALTIRDLVGERLIFRRERAVGLSASAYLGAKVAVYSVAALIQTAILIVIVVLGKGMPTHGGVLFGGGAVAATVELYATLAVTAIVSAMVGLALSSLARSSEQILPLLVVTIMASMVLSGGMIQVTGRLGLDQVSWLLPARWGFAAAASTVDLRAIDVAADPDRFWLHTRHTWLMDMGLLVLQGILATAFVRFRLRLGGHSHPR